MNQTIVGSRSGSIDFEGNKSAFVFIFYFDRNVRQKLRKVASRVPRDQTKTSSVLLD